MATEPVLPDRARAEADRAERPAASGIWHPRLPGRKPPKLVPGEG